MSDLPLAAAAVAFGCAFLVSWCLTALLIHWSPRWGLVDHPSERKLHKHVTPKGEKLYVQVMKTPLFGPDGKAIGIQGIFWDVTERLRAEEVLV